MACLTPLPPNPFLEMQSDHGALDAVQAALSDVLAHFTSADPEPPPGPSDAEEIEAILTRLQAA